MDRSKRYDLSKEYDIQGCQFTVEVARNTEKDDGTIFCWDYRIIVKGWVVQEHHYSWDTSKRPLTNMNVANHLATYWGNSPLVRQAMQAEDSPELKLDKLVFKCADLMHEYFKPLPDYKDFDIITKHQDDKEFLVVLRPNYMSGDYLISFYQCDGPVNVMVYRVSNSFDTVL